MMNTTICRGTPCGCPGFKGGYKIQGRVQNSRAGTRPAPTLGRIISAFKSLSTNAWAQCKFWQRNYYEHIIRNEQENLYV